jgi:pyruvate/2-oxoacid:ferredoxin oxidoreductase alpha subunit
MSPAAKQILEQVASWPEEDQEELAELAREIQARRDGVYSVSDDERKAIEEALDALNRGERVSDSDMSAFWRRVGAV